MRRIGFLMEKEFKQIVRNTILFRMMLGAPIMQLILLSYAANFEVKNLKLIVVDEDHSTLSRRLVGKFTSIPNFTLQGQTASYAQAYQAMLHGKTDLVLVLPDGMDRDLTRQGTAKIELMINAIDGTKAGVGSGYAQNIISAYAQDLSLDARPNLAIPQAPTLEVVNRYWYNPKLEYKTFMVPGILFELLILVGGMIAALNIVREKEIGTQEQLNVTPIKKHEFIIGKLLPFVIIGLVQYTMGLTVALLVFKVPVAGSIPLLYFFALLFLILCVGLGLFISAISSTQQQAVFAIFFCLMLFILLSGLFSSTDNMPRWAQYINTLNPLQYIISAGRNIMLKGSTLSDMRTQATALVVLAATLLSLAFWRFRKTA